MSKQILVTTAAFEDDDSYRSNLIKDLCKVHPSEWSPRENALMDNASDHGELYTMTISEKDGYKIYQTDLGDPGHEITVDIPDFIDEDKAAALVQLLAEGLAS